MDDIQFWIYVIFAIIYFVARNFKKGNKKSPQNRPQNQDEETVTDTPQPQSFEELLEEITGRRSISKPSEESRQKAESYEDDRYLQPKPWEEQERPVTWTNEFENEGRNRQFSDEESKRIYEESIKRAEGADLTYEVDKNFASSKVLRETAEEKQPNHFAEEINAMLKNSNDARKAIILGEILNRKY